MFSLPMVNDDDFEERLKRSVDHHDPLDSIRSRAGGYGQKMSKYQI